MKETLPIKRTDSIVDQIARMQEQITKRAYEIFEGNGCECGRDLENWLQAERELVWAPSIEVEEGDREITVKVSAPGVEAKDLDVELAPEDLLVEAETREEKDKGKGKARQRERKTAKLFRSVHFSKKVDPDSAKAEFKNGVLTLTAKVAENSAAEARKLKVVAG